MLGDAVGLTPPFTGNGMAMAFQAAETALPRLLARPPWADAGTRAEPFPYKEYAPEAKDRVWMSAEQREKARDLRLLAAQNGERMPVQVLEGNFTRMTGTCPWWDGVKAG